MYDPIHSDQYIRIGICYLMAWFKGLKRLFTKTNKSIIKQHQQTAQVKQSEQIDPLVTEFAELLQLMRKEVPEKSEQLIKSTFASLRHDIACIPTVPYKASLLDVVQMGRYYANALDHYPGNSFRKAEAIKVRCDACQTSIESCIGYLDVDVCLSCANKIIYQKYGRIDHVSTRMNCDADMYHKCERAFEYGTYYPVASARYGRVGAVTCDHCSKTDVISCIGFNEIDLCLACAHQFSNSSELISHRLQNAHGLHQLTCSA